MRALHLVLLMLTTALTAACATTPASTPEWVQVMSYNIRCGSCERGDDVNHWSRRKFLVADVIQKSKADVIGLQEAEAFQVKDLALLLADFDWVGVGRDDGLLGGEMNAVLVRRSAFSIASQKTLWLSATPEQVSRGWDAMLNRTVTVLKLQSRTSARAVYFVNTHFDHVGLTARSESARLIVQTVQALDQGLPVLLTGDLNDRPGFPGYRTLTTQLQDAATVSRTPAAGGDLTFNGFGKDIQPGNKIDYVFASSALQVLSHQVVTDLYEGRYPSDHYPIVVKVLLP
jgi:endonuclease/exonuclease/phosphatase family metal-dependent hydrolase